MDNIKIKIDNKEFTIRQSFRALMLFEEMTAKSVNNIGENVSDLLKLFYCILKANNQNNFEYTFDSFIDVMDEQPEAFQIFTNYLEEQAKDLPKEPQKKSKK